MKFNSIRFKASVLYSAILCIILVFFSGVLYSVTRHILYRDLDEELVIKANEVINIIHSYETLNRPEAQARHLINKLLGIPDPTRLIIDDLWRSNVRALNLKNDYIIIFNSLGRPVVLSQNVSKRIAALFRNQLPVAMNRVIYKNIDNPGHRLRSANLPFSFERTNPLVIQVATPLTGVDHLLNRLLVFIVAGIVFILALTSFLGSFFAWRILRPVLRVTEMADEISHTDLNRRIAEMAADEEMKCLIQSFNLMIGRLEKAFNHVNDFSSHVAHELKTPLAIIRGELELALSETRDTAEYQRVLKTSLEETDRLIRIVKDLLLLARLDYNPDIYHFEKFDLTSFLREIEENIRILAMEKQIGIRMDLPAGPIHIAGDRDHLRRLFFNLINNAVKFTPAGGQIGISLSIGDHAARIAVSDTGIGIAEKDLPRIFDKFFRVSQDSSVGFGSGLGLNIARSIAAAHKGDIIVHSRLGRGSTFTVILSLS